MMTEVDARAAPEEGEPVTGSDVPFYTIGQVAEVLGVPVAHLRRLDDLEVVQPSRSQGNQRRYTQNEIARLREVIDLTNDGVSLPGARMVIELQIGRASCRESVAVW